MIVSDEGAYCKISFAVTCSGAGKFTVRVNDGITDISTSAQQTSGSTYTVTLTKGAGKAWKSGITTYAIYIASTTTITNWSIKRTANTGFGIETPYLYWFYGNITTLTTENSMFGLYNASPNGAVYCTNLQAVYISSTSSIISMSNMFYNCYSLTSLPAVMDTTSCTNMNSMFYSCISLITVPAVMNLTNVGNTSNMFYYCVKLKQVPTILDLGNCTTTSGMFYFCCSLTAVPSVLNLTKCVTPSSMFYNCFSLTEVPSILDISSANTIASMFFGCYNLLAIPSALDVSKVTTAASAFGSCSKLTTVPATLNTVLCTDLSSTFSSCYSLTTIPSLNYSACTTASSIIANNSLYSGVIDMTGGTLMTKIAITYSGITGLTVSSSAPFSGTSPQIDVSYTNMATSALNSLFTSLPTVTGKTIKITGATGAATCTTSIATAKGWTVSN